VKLLRKPNVRRSVLGRVRKLDIPKLGWPKIPKHCDSLGAEGIDGNRLVIYRCDAPTRADRCRLGPNQTSASAERDRPGRPAELSNRHFLNGSSFIAKTGLPWRDLPERFGPWKTIHSRFTRWNKTGCLRAGAQRAGT